jgi:hypothetical protein
MEHCEIRKPMETEQRCRETGRAGAPSAFRARDLAWSFNSSDARAQREGGGRVSRDFPNPDSFTFGKAFAWCDIRDRIPIPNKHPDQRDLKPRLQLRRSPQ